MASREPLISCWLERYVLYVCVGISLSPVTFYLYYSFPAFTEYFATFLFICQLFQFYSVQY